MNHEANGQDAAVAPLTPDLLPACHTSDKQSSTLATHAAVFFAAFGGFTNLYSTQAIYPTLRDRFDMSAATAGALLTATTLGLALSAPIASRVSNRYGSKLAVLGGLLALVSLTLAFSLVNSTGLMMAIRLAQGAIIPVVLAALLSSLADLAKGDDSASLAASYTTATVLGGLTGRFTPAALVGDGHWALAFGVFAAMQAVLLVAVWILFPFQPVDKRESVPIGQWARGLLPKLTGQLLAVGVQGFCLLFAQMAITTWLAVRLASAPFNWSAGEIGTLYLVFVPALLLVRLTPHALSAWGEARTLRYAMAGAWFGLLATTSGRAWVIVAGLMLFSCAIFVGQATLARAAGQTGEPDKEAASGLYLCMLYLGASAGGVLPSAVWNVGGWLACLLLIAAVHLAGYLLIEEARDRSSV